MRVQSIPVASRLSSFPGARRVRIPRRSGPSEPNSRRGITRRDLLAFAVGGAAATTGLTGAAALLFGCVSPRIQMPRRKIYQTPGDFGAVFEEVSFSSSDGIPLSGWYLPAPTLSPSSGVVQHSTPKPPEPPTVLFFYGATGNKGSFASEIVQWSRLGLNMFVVDYRGYGESGGSPSARGIQLDGEAALRELVETRKVSPENIVLFGRSMGGTVAMPLAARLAREGKPIRGLILDATFPSITDVISDHANWFITLLVRDEYDSRGIIRDLTMPKLIIHGEEDPLVDSQIGRRLFEKLPGPKNFYSIPNGSHDDTFQVNPANYLSRVQQFLGLPK